MTRLPLFAAGVVLALATIAAWCALRAGAQADLYLEGHP